MKPSQLLTLLSHTIQAGRPVLITGGPGVGKTDIVTHAAELAGADLIISHPAVADPTDVKGLPWPDKDGLSATFLPFGELSRAVIATRPTVWFLDDLGQAPASVQASFMQLLLARRVNHHVLPDCVTFIAATNRRTDRAGVSGILEPVKSRFATIVELDADLNDWCTWAFAHDINPLLIAFLRFRANLLNDFKATADLMNSPTPRTWSNLAKIEALGLPRDVESGALAGAVGEGASAEYLAFRRIAQELPNIDDLLQDPDKGKIPDQPAALYAVVTGMAARSTMALFPNIVRYAERLTEAAKGEFAALLIRDSHRRDAAIASSPAFIKMATGPLGKLIGGGE